ncbi:TPA: hypothetical protein ACF1H3_003141 [Salmonella enterica]|uniref:hypothetical protein n=1 Tax=Salmonella enterica TaxID=28901 RepID=UPI000DFB2FEC|nr:hypothetical protein [Salmonella enterica]SUH48344.1 Uncharacterised protein [Salmonella enterica subsp. enterica] [Salmonella enterica subsp. enterica serovar Singapore]VEA27017.1 Uncharacterised protein [Salmonella enterica subsp. enterica]
MPLVPYELYGYEDPGMLMDVAKFIVTDIIISVAAGILTLIIIPVIISDIIVIAVAITFVVILEQLDNEIFHTSNDFKKAIKGGWAVHNQQLDHDIKMTRPLPDGGTVHGRLIRST